MQDVGGLELNSQLNRYGSLRVDLPRSGAGAIAVFAVDALAALGRFGGELRVSTRSVEGAAQFCAKMSARHGLRARPVVDPRTAVRGARLIVTSTTHDGSPFIERDWLETGTLVVMIDRLRVVTPGLLARSDRIVTTSRESLAAGSTGVWSIRGKNLAAAGHDILGVDRVTDPSLQASLNLGFSG